MRRQKWFVLVLVLLLAVIGDSRTPMQAVANAEKIKQEILNAENELTAALLKADKDALNRIWSEDLVFTNPAGKVSRKAARLAGLKPAPDQAAVESNHSDKIEIYPYSDVSAVATILSTWKTSRGEQQTVEQYQATHFWIKQSDHWRLVAAHVSVVAK